MQTDKKAVATRLVIAQSRLPPLLVDYRDCEACSRLADGAGICGVT
jgi:hypothetical protein